MNKFELQAKEFFAEHNPHDVFSPSIGTDTLDVNGGLVLEEENGKYVVFENFQPEWDGYENMPRDIREQFEKGKLSGQAVYGEYKRLGNALRSIIRGNSDTGRKPKYWR